MVGLIKNVPVLTFGIVGNRGLGFPLQGHLVENFISPYQTANDCNFIKEQDGDIRVTSENDIDFLIGCGDSVSEIRQPSLGCILSTEEDLDVNVFYGPAADSFFEVACE